MPEVAVTQETIIISTKKAAIIDDAYDDVEQGEIALTNFKEFMQIISENNKFETVLQKLNIPVPDISEWGDDSAPYLAHLRLLWSNRGDEELRALINNERLFANKLGKLEELEKVCANITEQNIEVERFKSTIDDLTIFENGDYVYIFIDYNLGVRSGDEAVKNAKKVTKEIYDQCPNDNKPVTILMSSDPHAGQLKTQFQVEAGMLEGVFRFSSKEDLGDKSKVSLLVRAYGEEFYSNHALQNYIQSLIIAANEAQEEFKKEVKTLRIEDYEFIQNSVLQEQQQPLGDYLAWLYGSHWANLLLRNKNLRLKQEEIDKVISEKAPLHHSLPSKKLSEIFMSALFEDGLDEIKYHPWEGQEQSVAKLPYLHLGDLFTKSGDGNVFMILNPQCDLERPKESSQKLSIFILPGRLDKIEHAPEKSVKTDFFIFEDSKYRIYWDFRAVITIPLKNFDEQVKKRGLDRKYRLRLPYALEIQQRFTSNMSRVGLPVSPPLSQSILIKVNYKKFNGDIIDEFIPKSDEYAFLPITSKQDKNIRLTLKFALDFKAALVKELDDLVKLKEESVENMPAHLAKSISGISNFIATFDDWFFKNRGFSYPEEGKFKQIEKDCLTITRDSQAFAAQTPFLINVVTKSIPTIEFEPAEGLAKEEKKSEDLLAENKADSPSTSNDSSATLG